MRKLVDCVNETLVLRKEKLNTGVFGNEGKIPYVNASDTNLIYNIALLFDNDQRITNALVTIADKMVNKGDKLDFIELAKSHEIENVVKDAIMQYKEKTYDDVSVDKHSKLALQYYAAANVFHQLDDEGKLDKDLYEIFKTSPYFDLNKIDEIFG